MRNPFEDIPIHDFPDKAIRRLTANHQNLAELVQEANPELARRLDFSRADLLDRSFLTEDWRGREADLLFRIPYLPGEDLPPIVVCLLAEHQSEPDVRMALRVLIYMVLYWDAEWREWEKHHEPREPLRLTPILPLVFHTGTAPWKTYRQLSELIHGTEELLDFIPKWKTLFVDLGTYTAEELIQKPSAWMQALAVVRAEDENTAGFQSVFEQVIQKLDRNSSLENMRWNELMLFVISWARLRRSQTEREALEELAKRSVTGRAHKRETVRMLKTGELSWYEEIMAERAHLQAEVDRVRTETAQQVRTETELQSFRQALKMNLTSRFGQAPIEVLKRIDEATDLERIQAAMSQVYQLKQPGDLKL